MKQHPTYCQYKVCKNDNVYGPKNRVLKPMRTGRAKGRHKRCKIRISTNPRIDVEVAVLVLETYVGPRPEGMLALHRDDDPTNNVLTNLYWGTHKQNAMDRRAKGSGFVLTEEQALEIRQRRLAGESGSALGREYGVSPQTVCDIYKQRYWRGV